MLETGQPSARRGPTFGPETVDALGRSFHPLPPLMPRLGERLGRLRLRLAALRRHFEGQGWVLDGRPVDPWFPADSGPADAGIPGARLVLGDTGPDFAESPSNRVLRPKPSGGEPAIRTVPRPLGSYPVDDREGRREERNLPSLSGRRNPHPSPSR
jgi:hypothetical protein